MDKGEHSADTLAVVRVRYQRLDSGRIEEIEHKLRLSDLAASVEQAGVGFRLAASVAEFSELLRNSPHATGSSYADVAQLLRPVALELHLDKQVQELLRHVEQASSLSRGE